MRKRLTQILTLLLFGSLSLSCMSANFGFHIHEDSRDQFVRVIQEAYITICTDEGCVRNPLKSSGSGVVVSSSNRGSYILTAAHVCELEPERIVPSPEYMDLVKQVEVNMSIVNLSQSEYKTEIISMDINSDLCLLYAEKYWNNAGPVRVSSSPAFEGERVYNVAAPVGIFYDNVVPLLEGFFMGADGLRAYYSIPAMGGSSGSPIFNIRGDLIGMIHSVNVTFPIVSISPNHYELKKFIETNVEAHKKQLEIKNKTLTYNLLYNILFN
jgi:S1-C subfamily serine protease